MKRFSKILTLILALVTILTAFTVVALAAEPGYTNQKGHQADLTFESAVADQMPTNLTNQDIPEDGGIFVREAYPGGNKYLELSAASTTTGKAGLSYNTTVGTKYAIRTTYTLGNYPTIAVDLDVMTPTGHWGGVYNGGSTGKEFNSSSSASFYIRPYIDKQMQGSVFNAIYFDKLGLSTERYEWQHVTVIYQLIVETDDEGNETKYVKQYAYVNGELAIDYAPINFTAKGIDPASYFIGPIYFSTARALDPSSKQAIDNVEFSYFDAGYDLNKIPTLVYNDSWTAPPKKAVAKVTVGGEDKYFDDMGAAAEYAKANGTRISLWCDLLDSFKIDSEFEIDTNKYDENGEIIGNYSFATPYTTVGYRLVETENPGIYKTVLGDFAVIDNNGTVTAYEAADFLSKFSASFILSRGYTFKLLNDIELDATFSLGADFNNVTLDLNGHDLICVSYSGNVYEAVMDETTGELTFPEENPTTVEAKGALFTYSADNVTFTITSDVPGSEITVLNSVANTWKYEGEIVKRTITSTSGRTFSDVTKSNAVLNLNNVSVYCVRFASQGNGSAWTQTINVDNSKIYMTATSAYFIYSYHKGNFNLNMNNSLIHFPAGNHGYIFRWVNASSSESHVTKVRFTNCDFIMNSAGYSVGMTIKTGVNHDALFDNCRTYNLGTATVPGINGTLGYYSTVKNSESSVPKAGEGYTQVDVNVSVRYTVPSNITSSKVTEGLVESSAVPTNTTSFTLTFNKLDTKAIDVNYIDTDGETVLETKQLTPGVDTLDADTYRYVKELDDDYINLLYQWADKNGNAVASGVIGLTDKGVAWPEGDCINLYAKESIDDVVKYVGGIKVAQFNIGYMSGLRYNLYLPANAPISDVSVEGFELGAATVKIGGFDYYVYSSVVGTIAAGEGAPIKVTFTYNETEYVQNWNLDVLDYATIVDMQGFEDADTANTEKLAIGNLLKFVKEALEFNSETTVDKFDEMIEYLGVSLDYGTYEQGAGGDLTQLGNVTGVSYVIYNGVASYRFYVTSADAALTFATANGENIAFTRGEGTDEEGNPEYYVTLDAMRVYDIIAPITVTAGDTNVQFSMLDYIAGNSEVELTKALYDFGVAAQNYKDYIISKN